MQTNHKQHRLEYLRNAAETVQIDCTIVENDTYTNVCMIIDGNFWSSSSIKAASDVWNMDNIRDRSWDQNGIFWKKKPETGCRDEIELFFSNRNFFSNFFGSGSCWDPKSRIPVKSRFENRANGIPVWSLDNIINNNHSTNCLFMLWCICK